MIEIIILIVLACLILLVIGVYQINENLKTMIDWQLYISKQNERLIEVLKIENGEERKIDGTR